MIYSVSIRTDVPAYYGDWFMDKLRRREIGVRNPYYPEKVSIYDLSPDQVDCLCLISKNWKPFLKHMPEILKDYAVMCDYTITGYDRDVEPNVPWLDESIETFRELSRIVGPKRVAWRYDPIFLYNSPEGRNYDMIYHMAAFQYIAERLDGYTERVYFSFLNRYEKVKRNFQEAVELDLVQKNEIISYMARTLQNRSHPMFLQGCPSQVKDLDPDVAKLVDTSGCITASMINYGNPGIELKDSKARNNKFDCTCIVNKDIGTYDTCLHNCRYCYANSFPGVAKNRECVTESLLLCDEIREGDIVTRSKQRSYRA